MGEPTLQDDLIAAKALIDTPEKWRKDGAVEFSSCCAIVAVNRAAWQNASGRRRELWKALSDALPGPWDKFAAGDSFGEAVAYFNDAPETAHRDVMALFNRAIEAAA